MQVTMIAAATLCGRISPAGFGSPVDRRRLERMRSGTDAGLIGAATLRQEDPEMRGLDNVLPPNRIRAVITRSGRIPLSGKKMFGPGPRPFLFTGLSGSRQLDSRAGDYAHIVVLPETEDGVSIRAVVDHLAGLGVASLLIEGGGRLNYAAVQAGVVNELLLTLTPYLSGDNGAASVASGPGPLAEAMLPLQLVSCEPADTGEIFLRYRLG